MLVDNPGDIVAASSQYLPGLMLAPIPVSSAAQRCFNQGVGRGEGPMGRVSVEGVIISHR
jgi:hypothetical protein